MKMSTPRLFFRVDGDDAFCYNLKYFKEEIIKERDEIPVEITHHILLREAKITFGDGTFYCKEFGFCGTVYDSGCGSDCKEYAPRNKRSGRCRHSSNCYEPGGRTFQLTITKPGKIKLVELK